MVSEPKLGGVDNGTLCHGGFLRGRHYYYALLWHVLARVGAVKHLRAGVVIVVGFGGYAAVFGEGSKGAIPLYTTIGGAAVAGGFNGATFVISEIDGAVAGYAAEIALVDLLAQPVIGTGLAPAVIFIVTVGGGYFFGAGEVLSVAELILLCHGRAAGDN